MDIVLQRQAPFDPTADWSENFRFGPGDSLKAVLDEYEETCAATDAIIEDIADLDQPVPVPRDTRPLGAPPPHHRDGPARRPRRGSRHGRRPTELIGTRRRRPPR
jgi:hypothetical protein